MMFLICEMKLLSRPESTWVKCPLGVIEGEEGASAESIGLAIKESLEKFGFQDVQVSSTRWLGAKISYGRAESYLRVRKIHKLSGDYIAGCLREVDF